MISRLPVIAARSRWLPVAVAAWLVGPAAAEIRLADEPPGEAYRLGAVAVAPRAALAAGALALLCDYRDERTYYRLRIHDELARFERVEQGAVTPLGVAGTIHRVAPAERLELAVYRDRYGLKALCNKVVCARAEDERLPAGAVGWAVEGTGLSLDEFEVQPVEDIYFSDDFMRTGEELGEWSALQGQWENNQQGSKSSRSANAFSFRCAGAGESLAAAGYPFWTDYAAQVAVRCDGTGAVGLAVGVADAGHYLRLRWTSRRNSDGGTCRLQRVFDGQVTDLTPPLPGGFREQVWYKLQMTIAGGRLLAWIDDAPVFDVAVQTGEEGQVGLWCEPGAGDGAEGGGLFDDLLVRSWPMFVDDFRESSDRRWEALGRWALGSGPDGAATAEGPGRLVTGSTAWTDLSLSADCRLGDVAAGLAVHVAGDDGYLFRCRADGVELVARQAGRETVLDRRAMTITTSDQHRLGLDWDHGLLTARLDEVRVLEGFDLGLPAGRCALLSDGAQATFDRVRVSFRPVFYRLPPTLPADFVTDQYMTNWASPSAAWVQVEGSPARWHKGCFYGDRRIAFTVPGVGQQEGSIRLVLGAGTTAAADAFQLELALTRQAPPLRLTLTRGDQVLARVEPEVTESQPPMMLELRGRFILVWLSGRNVLRYALPEDRP